MKLQSILYPIFIAIVLFTFSCSDNGCQSDRQNIESLKIAYENNPSQSNCLAYASALESYLSKSCDNPDQIFYDNIFSSYLAELNCVELVQEGTCDDGLQNGDEEGVDCGGTFCPPCPPAGPVISYIRFDFNGTSYELEASTNTGDAGNSSTTNYVFSQGNITDDGDFGALEVHFFQSSTIALSNFEDLVGFPIAFNNPGVDNFASLEINVGGTTYTSAGAGNDGSNSQFIVLLASIENDTPETYRVRGVFNCQVADFLGNTSSVDNGTFELIFDSL